MYLAVAFTLFSVRLLAINQQRLSRQIFYIALALMFVFVAFRWEVGCDWSSYLVLIDESLARQRYGEELGRDPLWHLVIYAVTWLGLPVYWVNVAMAAVFFAGIYHLGKKLPDPLGFFVLLFPVLIVNLPMSGIRQAAAVGMMCFAFSAVLQRQSYRFLIYTTVAAAFHASAIVFLPLFPLIVNLPGAVRALLLVAATAPAVWLLSGWAVTGAAVTLYVEAGRQESAGAVFRLAMLAGGGAFFWAIARNWKQFCPHDFRIYAFSAALMSSLILLTPISTVIPDRLGYYFIPIQCAIFTRPQFLKLGESRTFMVLAPYVGLLVFFGVYTSSSQLFNQCMVPYQSWLLGVPLSW